VAAILSVAVWKRGRGEKEAAVRWHRQVLPRDGRNRVSRRFRVAAVSGVSPGRHFRQHVGFKGVADRVAVGTVCYDAASAIRRPV